MRDDDTTVISRSEGEGAIQRSLLPSIPRASCCHLSSGAVLALATPILVDFYRWVIPAVFEVFLTVSHF